MAINKKLIHFLRLADFEARLANNEILDSSIVFIKDANKIWTHGSYYDGSTVDLTTIENSILNILDNKQDKLVSGTNIKTINGESLLGSNDIAVAALDNPTFTTKITTPRIDVSLDTSKIATLFSNGSLLTQIQNTTGLLNYTVQNTSGGNIMLRTANTATTGDKTTIGGDIIALASDSATLLGTIFWLCNKSATTKVVVLGVAKNNSIRSLLTDYGHGVEAIGGNFAITSIEDSYKNMTGAHFEWKDSVLNIDLLFYDSDKNIGAVKDLDVNINGSLTVNKYLITPDIISDRIIGKSAPYMTVDSDLELGEPWGLYSQDGAGGYKWCIPADGKAELNGLHIKPNDESSTYGGMISFGNIYPGMPYIAEESDDALTIHAMNGLYISNNVYAVKGEDDDWSNYWQIMDGCANFKQMSVMDKDDHEISVISPNEAVIGTTLRIVDSLTVSGTSSFNDSVALKNGDLYGYDYNGMQIWAIFTDGYADFKGLNVMDKDYNEVSSISSTAAYIGTPLRIVDSIGDGGVIYSDSEHAPTLVLQTTDFTAGDSTAGSRITMGNLSVCVDGSLSVSNYGRGRAETHVGPGYMSLYNNNDEENICLDAYDHSWISGNLTLGDVTADSLSLNNGLTLDFGGVYKYTFSNDSASDGLLLKGDNENLGLFNYLRLVQYANTYFQKPVTFADTTTFNKYITAKEGFMIIDGMSYASIAKSATYVSGHFGVFKGNIDSMPYLYAQPSSINVYDESFTSVFSINPNNGKTVVGGPFTVSGTSSFNDSIDFKNGDLYGYDYNGVQSWTISPDGSANFRTVTQTSDITLKNIQNEYKLELADIANSSLFKFTWFNSDDLHIGTSALYWQNVLPEVVHFNDGVLSLAYGELGVAMGISLAKEMVDMVSRIENTEYTIELLLQENIKLKKELEELRSHLLSI